MTTIVFLHIPKTAGQNVHNAIAARFSPGEVSPVRVHTQPADGRQMPPGYKFYSGHIDWTEVDELPTNRFVFTILRDPRERIASFYFYLRKEAEALSNEALKRPENTGKRLILEWSADDYFFGGDRMWSEFILDHYDNFYCHYLATRKMRGRSTIATLSTSDLIDRAKAGASEIDTIYSLTALEALEQDLAKVLGGTVRLANRVQNQGPIAQKQLRWPKLLERFESDALARRLERFVIHDEKLMHVLNVG